MKNDFENEASEIIGKLKLSDGYLECEKVVIENMKKQLATGYSIAVMEAYLINLLNFFREHAKQMKEVPMAQNTGMSKRLLKTYC